MKLLQLQENIMQRITRLSESKRSLTPEYQPLYYAQHSPHLKRADNFETFESPSSVFRKRSNFISKPPSHQTSSSNPDELQCMTDIRNSPGKNFHIQGIHRTIHRNEKHERKQSPNVILSNDHRSISPSGKFNSRSPLSPRRLHSQSPIGNVSPYSETYNEFFYRDMDSGSSNSMGRSRSPQRKRFRQRSRSRDTIEDSCSLFVGNLPKPVSFHDVRQFFHSRARMNVKLINNIDGTRVGCGYVQFPNADYCSKALKEHKGTYLKHRKIQVERCSDKEFDLAHDSHISTDTQGSNDAIHTLKAIEKYGNCSIPTKSVKKNFTCIQISNIPDKCSKYDIMDFFKGLHIEFKKDVYIEYDLCGSVKGNCYVKFETYQDADSAEQYDGRKFMKSDNEIKIIRISSKVMVTEIERHQYSLKTLRHTGKMKMNRILQLDMIKDKSHNRTEESNHR